MKSVLLIAFIIILFSFRNSAQNIEDPVSYMNWKNIVLNNEASFENSGELSWGSGFLIQLNNSIIACTARDFTGTTYTNGEMLMIKDFEKELKYWKMYISDKPDQFVMMDSLFMKSRIEKSYGIFLYSMPFLTFTVKEMNESVINTYLNLKLSPPAGEGFTFEGEPVTSEPSKDPLVYLRSFGDALKELLKAVKREKRAGIEHEDWIAWAQTFADWLLPQQKEDGGFPRSWRQGTGEVSEPFPESSYIAIPFLVLLSEITGDNRYVESAQKAGEFCWNSTQKEGVFVGATLDNPHVIDKEAGTISLEAYLMLYKYTSEKKWLNRAIAAANFAETWIYLWNVPMPEDEENKDIHWQKGLSTVGIQLISTGHSLTDMYMSFDTDEFAELYLNTGDNHYYDVAMILLHNTKTMLTLPGRDFGLKGPGWQQEHWSMAPVRGVGLYRNWNPWVATSQLNGILELEELDKELYRKMIGKDNAFK